MTNSNHINPPVSGLSLDDLEQVSGGGPADLFWGVVGNALYDLAKSGDLTKAINIKDMAQQYANQQKGR
ncbi:MAG: hypothetical protein KGK16_14675 [Bradyrhizobium sp.]|nr:hypothetical protein [Bradyrhizobium sp.]